MMTANKLRLEYKREIASRRETLSRVSRIESIKRIKHIIKSIKICASKGKTRCNFNRGYISSSMGDLLIRHGFCIDNVYDHQYVKPHTIVSWDE